MSELSDNPRLLVFCHCCWRVWLEWVRYRHDTVGRCQFGCFETYGGGKHVAPLGAHAVPAIHEAVTLAAFKLGGHLAGGAVLKDLIGEQWKGVGRNAKRASYDKGE